jgi:hypothetical protein
MKCFEWLGLAHINTIIPETLDPLQFAYCPNRSTISIVLHTALSHLDTYMRMLFIEYSSAFNTIAPIKLITKLTTLGPNTSPCNWILDFLTDCSPMTAWLVTTPTPSLRLLMTQHWGGLITVNDETACREEVRDLAVWCQDNNLSINVSIVDKGANRGLQEKEG